MLLGVLALFWLIIFKKITIDARIEISQNTIIIVTPEMFRVAAYKNFTLKHYKYTLDEITSVTLKMIKRPQNEYTFIGRGQLTLVISTSVEEREIPVDSFEYNAMIKLFRTIPTFKE